ncbi:MAG: hypothetical protein AB7K37_16185 [Cyclobacteriaceae bacterium]
MGNVGSRLPMAAVSMRRNTQPVTTQITAKGMMREIFRLNLGENLSII